MDTKKQLKKLIFIILIPIGYFIQYLSSYSPRVVELIYTQKIYKLLIQILSFITGNLPFSVAEIFVIFALIFFLFRFSLIIRKIVQNRSKGLYSLLSGFINMLAFLSILYFSFILLWGLNYHRLPFAQIANYNIENPSTDELIELCRDLAVQTNDLRKSVEEDNNGVMKLSTDINDTLKRSYKGYDNIKNLFPQLSGNYGRPKRVLLSAVMSYTGIEGVYFPFTGEANVNISIPHCDIPFTACHEMAHQRGFSREDEANYISYLVCSSHPDIDFQYSGSLLALIYSINALYKYDPELYSSIRESLSIEVKRDLNATRQYWQKFETPVQEFSSSVNDTYLKANMQKDGVKSYGRMVDLLIASKRQKQ